MKRSQLPTGPLALFLVAVFVGLVALLILMYDKGWMGWGERANDWRDRIVWEWFGFEP